jgi:ABC-type uncharacterized transport system YnjBCD permease subunit
MAEGYSGKFVVRVPKMLHARLAARARAEDVSLNQYVNTILAEALGRASDSSTAQVTSLSGGRQRKVAHPADKPGPAPRVRNKRAAASTAARRKG